MKIFRLRNVFISYGIVLLLGVISRFLGPAGAILGTIAWLLWLWTVSFWIGGYTILLIFWLKQKWFERRIARQRRSR